MSPVPDDRPYLSAGQAARILGVSPKTLNRWADEGRIPCVVTGAGHRRFREEAIRAVAISMESDDSKQPDEASGTARPGPNDEPAPNGGPLPRGDGAN